MDIYTAFLLGVLVGHWILLCAIWRLIVRLAVMMNIPDEENNHAARYGRQNTKSHLLEDGQFGENRHNDW